MERLLEISDPARNRRCLVTTQVSYREAMRQRAHFLLGVTARWCSCGRMLWPFVHCVESVPAGESAPVQNRCCPMLVHIALALQLKADPALQPRLEGVPVATNAITDAAGYAVLGFLSSWRTAWLGSV